MYRKDGESFGVKVRTWKITAKGSLAGGAALAGPDGRCFVAIEKLKISKIGWKQWTN